MTEDQMKEMTAEQLQAWIGSADFGRIFASKDSVDKKGNVIIEGPFGGYLRKVALVIAETAAGSTCLLKIHGSYISQRMASNVRRHRRCRRTATSQRPQWPPRRCTSKNR
jgi:hypothetical protein